MGVGSFRIILSVIKESHKKEIQLPEEPIEESTSQFSAKTNLVSILLFVP